MAVKEGGRKTRGKFAGESEEVSVLTRGKMCVEKNWEKTDRSGNAG